MNSKSTKLSGSLPFLVALLVLLFPAPFFANGGPGSKGSTSVTPGMAGEDVESVPRQQAERGFVLEVDTPLVEKVLRNLRGSGGVDVVPGTPGHMRIVLRGRVALVLDRDAVLQGRVSFTYAGDNEANARVHYVGRKIYLVQR